MFSICLLQYALSPYVGEMVVYILEPAFMLQNKLFIK